MPEGNNNNNASTDASAPTQIEIQSGFVDSGKHPIYLRSAIINFLLWFAIIAIIPLGILGNEFLHPNLEDYHKDVDTNSFIGFVLIATFLPIIFVVYIVEILFCCKVSRYLRDLNKVDEDMITYVNRIKNVKPVLSITCHCYHYETRSGQVPSMDFDSDGRSRVTYYYQTWQERVVTYKETKTIDYSTYEDDSGVITDDVRKWNAIHVDYTKTWRAGDEYTRNHIDGLIKRLDDQNRNRDTCYEHWVVLDLEGFIESSMLSLVDRSKRPDMLDWSAYMIISFLFLMSWPYKFWLSKITAEGTFQLKKIIYIKPGATFNSD